jgi:hypothetical protein
MGDASCRLLLAILLTAIIVTIRTPAASKHRDIAVHWH